jgi:hypothetical protein
MSAISAALIAAVWAMSANAAPQVRAQDFRVQGVRLTDIQIQGEPALEMTMPSSAYQDPEKEKLTDRAFMAWLPVDFKDGVIEVELAGELAADAPAYARGFVGVSFRIDAHMRFENIYLRPTNGVAEDQVRRNHTVQYFAYPDYPFDRLRKEAPEAYETAADVAPGRWVRLKLVVSGQKAKLFLDDRPTPTLIVNDLKLGADQRGGVGLWIESGTLARFRNLTITPAP